MGDSRYLTRASAPANDASQKIIPHSLSLAKTVLKMGTVAIRAVRQRSVRLLQCLAQTCQSSSQITADTIPVRIFPKIGKAHQFQQWSHA